MNKLKAGVIGATGYAGVELVRLLQTHPSVTIAAVSSVSYEGDNISDIYPNLKKINESKLTTSDDVIEQSDVVFASLPHGLSEDIAEKCIDKMPDKAVFIDLGADFRLRDEEVYTKWYDKLTYKKPELHLNAVYGLPEFYRDEIKKSDIIGNPGCYPTSIALALLPLLKHKLLSEGLTIIADSKSGVTGAGRGLTQTTHFPDNNEAFSAYKAGAHRHTPEIEQTLSDIAGFPVKLTFVPHLLPVNRGIESTIYLKTDKNISEIFDLYTETYKSEPFVRIEPVGKYANIKNVRLSNYCDISLHYDSHTQTLIICSVIDNLVKGAAGQAIQNMNIRFGFPETAGLDGIPPAF
jgi:N-acetyl-gamma-glutamyl-phosphate reductase